MARIFCGEQHRVVCRLAPRTLLLPTCVRACPPLAPAEGQDERLHAGERSAPLTHVTAPPSTHATHCRGT
eukprot:3547865-Prymnesium_polylepis.1